jgi:hypothetical protein
MNNFNHVQIEGDIQSALKLCGWVKLLKLLLAALVVVSYFFISEWLTEIIVISVVVSLVLPLGFFDAFIQKLLEYNTQKVEERQVLNANEANEQFEKIYQKLGK